MIAWRALGEDLIYRFKNPLALNDLKSMHLFVILSTGPKERFPIP
jgi:hypothetical protein